MSLEQRVRQEVDSYFSGKEVNDIDRLKAAYYGIGIKVTESLIDILKDTVEVEKDYLSLPYRKAAKEFNKDLVVWHYVNNNFLGRKTAEDVGLLYTGIRSASSHLCRLFYLLGMKTKDVRKNPKKYLSRNTKDIFAINDEELAGAAKRLIDYYCKDDYADDISRMLVNIAKDNAKESLEIPMQKYMDLIREKIRPYSGLNHWQALRTFRDGYLAEQLLRCDRKTSEAAKRSGTSVNSYRATLSMRGIVKKLASIVEFSYRII